MTETAPFTTTSGRYLSTLIGLWLPRHGWKIALPLIAVAAAGIILPDARLILVALMLLFIVMPMGMSFLYTYYMLTPEARRAILPKQVMIAPGEYIRLHYLPSEKPETEKTDETDGTAIDTFPVPADETIPWTDIRRVKLTSSAIVYILNTKRLQFILIPSSAIPKGAILTV